jgi:hypothetical protein
MARALAAWCMTYGPAAVGGSSAPPPPPSLPSSPPPCSVRLSGFTCANGNNAALNQLYIPAGKTADGNTYYMGATGGQSASSYLFYDSNCGGGGQAWASGWFFGCGAPSTSASSNLQGGSGSCCNDGNREGLGSGLDLPLGTHTWWRWCGRQAASGSSQLTLTEDCDGSWPPSAPPSADEEGGRGLPVAVDIVVGVFCVLCIPPLVYLKIRMRRRRRRNRDNRPPADGAHEVETTMSAINQRA